MILVWTNHLFKGDDVTLTKTKATRQEYLDKMRACTPPMPSTPSPRQDAGGEYGPAR
jgi:hypothetical protein